MNRLKSLTVPAWLESFILIAAGTYLQFIGMLVVGSSASAIYAWIAFISTLLALAATIGSLKKLIDELTEAKCA